MGVPFPPHLKSRLEVILKDIIIIIIIIIIKYFCFKFLKCVHCTYNNLLSGSSTRCE